MPAARKRVGAAHLLERGSNMVSLAEAAQALDYPAELALVLSNTPDVAGLRAGAASALPRQRSIIGPSRKDPMAFERAVDELLRVNQIDLVVLAGFMRILTP